MIAQYLSYGEYHVFNTGVKRMQAHLKWLKSIELGRMDRETLNKCPIPYEYQTNWVETFDKRIEKLRIYRDLQRKIAMSHILGVEPEEVAATLA